MSKGWSTLAKSSIIIKDMHIFPGFLLLKMLNVNFAVNTNCKTSLSDTRMPIPFVPDRLLAEAWCKVVPRIEQYIVAFYISYKLKRLYVQHCLRGSILPRDCQLLWIRHSHSRKIIPCLKIGKFWVRQWLSKVNCLHYKAKSNVISRLVRSHFIRITRIHGQTFSFTLSSFSTSKVISNWTWYGGHKRMYSICMSHRSFHWYHLLAGIRRQSGQPK